MILVLILVGISALGASGIAFQKPMVTEKNYGTATLDLCTIDPENADIWQTQDINLWKYPGGSEIEGQNILSKLPSCEGIEVTVIDIYSDDTGYTYYKIKSGSKEGWVTKSLLPDIE